MAFCRFCGWKIPDAALFCNYCGRSTSITSDQLTGMTNVPPSDAPTTTGQPLPASLQGQTTEEDETQRQYIAPVIPIPNVPTAPEVPMVQGAPQVGTVPSIVNPGSLAGGAATVTVGTMAKVLFIAILCATVVVGAVKVLPPIFSPSKTSTNAPVSVPVPPTQTSCPPTGTARAAVTAPLALGNHQEIVYFQDGGDSAIPTSGVLNRYDVATGKTTEIVKLTNMSINNAQLSPDGQWILFVGKASQQKLFKLQMIRLDGQGLQTLYCSTADEVKTVQWSPNQKLIALMERSTSTTSQFGPAHTFVLDMRTGTMKTIVSVYYFAPYKWLDNTRLYIDTTEEADGPRSLFLLDTSRSSVQQFNDMVSIYPSGSDFVSNWDATNSLDGSQLILGSPGSISTQPATGGTQRIIFSDPTLVIAKIRAISRTTFLLLVNNGNFNGTPGTDTSKNGLWEIGTDGQNLKNVTLDNAGTVSYLNLFDQSTWSNVSRDGSMYTLAIASSQGVSLIFGPLKGGAPKTFASSSEAQQSLSYNPVHLAVVGWATM